MWHHLSSHKSAWASVYSLLASRHKTNHVSLVRYTYYVSQWIIASVATINVWSSWVTPFFSFSFPSTSTSVCPPTTRDISLYVKLNLFSSALVNLSCHPNYLHVALQMLRTALVHNKHLASLCQELGFQEFIITSESKVYTLTNVHS